MPFKSPHFGVVNLDSDILVAVNLISVFFNP